MLDQEIKKQFEDYRESLHTELQTLHSMIDVIGQIDNLDSVEFRRCSPAFYKFCRFSLIGTVVMWASKLFTESHDKKEINSLKFMRFADSNYKRLFGAPDYSKKSWSISKEQHFKYLDDVEQLVHFKELETIRNKYYAHFDKQYFFDQSVLFESNKITLSQIDCRTIRFHEILMNYSKAYDGKYFVLKIHNINDFKHLMWLINQYNINQKLDVR